jgi:peroxiredoxin Q/BCP
MPVEVGKTSPAFTLLDATESKVRLADFRGRWVVLYFYPKDDTPGCTIQACDFTEGIGAFRDLDAVVIGCSPDDAASHSAFIEKHDLAVTLVSDPSHRVMEKYGAYGEKVLYGRKFMGVIRSTVLIDPTGKVAHHWRRARAKGHAEKVREKLEELRAG